MVYWKKPFFFYPVVFSVLTCQTKIKLLFFSVETGFSWSAWLICMLPCRDKRAWLTNIFVSQVLEGKTLWSISCRRGQTYMHEMTEVWSRCTTPVPLVTLRWSACCSVREPIPTPETTGITLRSMKLPLRAKLTYALVSTSSCVSLTKVMVHC